MNSVRTIRAAAEHLPAIRGLAEVVWRSHYPGIISDAQITYMLGRMYDLDVLRHELENGMCYLCLFAGTELAAFSAHGPVGNEMKLHKLYVDPAHQRKGFGSLLLQQVEADSRARGFRTLILGVNKANHKAIAAYHKNGFNIRESVVVDIGQGFVMDDYVMAKALGPPTAPASPVGKAGSPPQRR